MHLFQKLYYCDGGSSRIVKKCRTIFGKILTVWTWIGFLKKPSHSSINFLCSKTLADCLWRPLWKACALTGVVCDLCFSPRKRMKMCTCSLHTQHLPRSWPETAQVRTQQSLGPACVSLLRTSDCIALVPLDLCYLRNTVRQATHRGVGSRGSVCCVQLVFLLRSKQLGSI